MSLRPAQRGFTLVELLVVVLIIGILAAIALPRFLGQRTRSKNAQAQVAVRQALAAARSWYSSDGRESYAGLCADASNARGESRCSGKTAISSLESSLGTAEPADNQTPGSGANPQDIWMGNGVSGSDPSGDTVTLCSVSRGDTVYCIKDKDGVASYYAFQGASVLAGADGSLYSATGWSTAITIDALVAGTPTVSGTATVGSQLSGTAGSWSGTTASTAWSWVWRRCNSSGSSCADIAGSSGTATGSGAPAIPAYTLVSADSGNTIRLQVQAQNGGGSCSLGVNCASADSAQTAMVATLPVAGTPTVSGTTTVGSSLSGAAGSWSGTTSSTAWSWVWRRCDTAGSNCADIAGSSGTATGAGAPTIPAYTLVSADSGNTIRLQVQAQNGGSCSLGVNCAVGNSSATATIGAGSTYASTVAATSGLVNYWRLEETSGTSVADSKSSLTAAFNTAPTWSTTTPTASSTRSAQLNGSMAFGVAPYTYGSSGSLEMWGRRSETTNVVTWYQGDWSGGDRRMQGINTQMLIFFTDGTNSPSANTFNVQDTSWHHLVYTWTSSGGSTTVTSYKDAVQIGTSTYAKTFVSGSSAGGIRFGACALSGAFNIACGSSVYGLTGYLDEVATYNVALSAATVSAHYAAR